MFDRLRRYLPMCCILIDIHFVFLSAVRVSMRWPRLRSIRDTALRAVYSTSSHVAQGSLMHGHEDLTLKNVRCANSRSTLCALLRCLDESQQDVKPVIRWTAGQGIVPDMQGGQIARLLHARQRQGAVRDCLVKPYVSAVLAA